MTSFEQTHLTGSCTFSGITPTYLKAKVRMWVASDVISVVAAAAIAKITEDVQAERDVNR